MEGFGASPCAVVAGSRRANVDEERGVGAFGHLLTSPVFVDTPFDLASLTKPVTSLTVARLERRGVLSRAERLGDLLPRTRGTPSEDLPLDLFLAHRAGLEAHQPLFAPIVNGGRVTAEEAIVQAASSRRAACEGHPTIEGFPPVYSDMGYFLVGAAIEARTGEALDAVMHREVFAPLDLAIGSARRLRAQRVDFDARVAPTEVVAWRGGLVRGDVHDENAWALGGDAVCGHAGLFGDALSTLNLGVAILDAMEGRRDEWLTATELEPLVRDRPNGSLLAGFDRKSGDAPSSGSRFGARTFGHLGFTGTSIWIDPDARMVGVLLTNRVHPTREHIAIRKARPAVYDAIAARFGVGLDQE